MSVKNQVSTRRSGSVLLVALLIMVMLGALVTAQVLVQTKNLEQSVDFLELTDLHKYAEAGIVIGVHDLRYAISGYDGHIGTAAWTVFDDVGRDGVGGTQDRGEGDGIPTVGEPNVVPASIGPTQGNASIIVHVFDTGYANIQRVVATATRGEETATVEHYILEKVATVPRVSAMFIDPNVVLDLKGNSFLIDGNDYNPDGTPGPGPGLFGIATAEGTTPGDNQAAIVAQIPAARYDQVVGVGPTPSVGEATGVDVESVYNAFSDATTHVLPPGTHASVTLGDYATGDLHVTHVDGDLHLSGNGSGAGVLIVNGSLTMSGTFEFDGLVIVRGDVRLTGGGAGKHIYGSLIVGQSFTATDQVTLSGNADIMYSSVMLDQVQTLVAGNPSYESVAYDEQ